jgi:hypothetical protein
MVRPIPRSATGDLATDKAIDPMRNLLNELAVSPLLQGRLIEDVAIESGATIRIYHGLGRQPRGWFVVDLVGPSTSGHIERVIGGDRERVLQLKATGYGAAIKVAVWIF